MRSEDLRDRNYRQPFVPYRIDIRGGQAYDLRHPDRVIVLRSRVIIGIDSESNIADRVTHLALIQIAQSEKLSSESVA
jgi:hypothetical protein